MEIHFRRIRIRITFGFFAVNALYILSGAAGSETVSVLLFCIMHELAHLWAMSLSDIRVSRITVYSGGFEIKSRTPIDMLPLPSRLFILSAGCAANILAAIIFKLMGFQLWSLINLSLALFNLLPCAGLDGGELIRAAAETICPDFCIDRLQQAIGAVVVIAAAAVFILRGSISFTFPLTLALIAFEKLDDHAL